MTSAISLIIVVCCCMYVNAVPYHGRSAPEIDDYEYELENRDYQYVDDDDPREEPLDRDLSYIPGSGGSANRYAGRGLPRYAPGGYAVRYPLHKYKTAGRQIRRNPPLKYGSPRRTNRRNLGHTYNENINIHDTRDIWGEFAPSNSASDEYLDDGQNSGSLENVNLPNIIDHIKDTLRPGKPLIRPGRPVNKPGKFTPRPEKPPTTPAPTEKAPEVTPAVPTASVELPEASVKLPVVSEEPPVTSEEPPVTSEEPPATSEAPPATSEEPPVTSEPPKTPENPPAAPKEEFQCSNGFRGINARYSISFPLTNTSSEPTHTRSVHTGGDLTLCWIETVTTKEDNSTEPPKRLVVREYTITFENSVLIPDEYLECPRLNGEIHPTTKDEATNTSFQEYFTSDARKSKVTILNKVSREGNLTVIEEKTIRCGTGSLITKDVYEWLDVVDEPVKRVEIKVGPMLKSVTDDSEDDTEQADDVSAITDDCFIDGTCTTSGNSRTVTTTISSAESAEETSPSSGESSCEQGDEGCIKKSDLTADEDEGSTGKPNSGDLVLGGEDNITTVAPASVPEISTVSGELGDEKESLSTTDGTQADEASKPKDDSNESEGKTSTKSAKDETKSKDDANESEIKGSTQSAEEETKLKEDSNESDIKTSTELADDETETTATRRTTFETASPIEDDQHRPRYALKLRVILERTDENDEKQTLVNLKKEMPLSHKNRTYMDQLDAFNDSISDLAVIRDLLKCSAFDGVLPIVWGYVGSGSDEDESMSRRRRSAPVESSKNSSVSDELLEQWLPDIQEDIAAGLNAMKKEISENPGEDVLTNESDALPTKGPDFSRDLKSLRLRRSADGDSGAISHWSHERFREGSDGGQMRSFTELVIDENSED